jgi:hypothetical protein
MIGAAVSTAGFLGGAIKNMDPSSGSGGSVFYQSVKASERDQITE